MNFPFARPLRACSFVCLSLLAGPALADGDAFAIGNPGYWRLVVSPLTQHFRYSAEHRPVWALGVERQRSDDWLGGVTYFRNSFGQPSGYLYVGYRFEHVIDNERFFLQWSGGLLYGYKGKYQTKVPLNFNGYAPGMLFSAGWRFNAQNSVALHLLGDAAVMLQLAYEFH